MNLNQQGKRKKRLRDQQYSRPNQDSVLTGEDRKMLGGSSLRSRGGGLLEAYGKKSRTKKEKKNSGNFCKKTKNRKEIRARKDNS